MGKKERNVKREREKRFCKERKLQLNEGFQAGDGAGAGHLSHHCVTAGSRQARDHPNPETTFAPTSGDSPQGPHLITRQQDPHRQRLRGTRTRGGAGSAPSSAGGPGARRPVPRLCRVGPPRPLCGVAAPRGIQRDHGRTRRGTETGRRGRPTARATTSVSLIIHLLSLSESHAGLAVSIPSKGAGRWRGARARRRTAVATITRSADRTVLPN